MELKDFTFLLSFSNVSEKRNRNFSFVLGFLNSFNCNIVIAEQVFKTGKSDETFKKENLIHIKHYSTERFKKSYLYNLAAKHSDTPYLWFLDCDVVLPIHEIVKQIQGEKIIQPFSYIFNLDEEQSDLFISGAEPSIENSTSDSFFSKYSFIIDRSVFLKTGGFDERFKGWGWEDLDFCLNKLKSRDIFVCKNIAGYHLHHEKASRHNDRLNYRIFKKNQGLSPLLTLCIDFYSIGFDSAVFHNLLKYFFCFKDSCNLCIFLNKEDADNFLKIDFLEPFLGEGFISIFLCESNDLPTHSLYNYLGHLSIGDNFYIPKSVLDLNQIVLMKLLDMINSKKRNLFEINFFNGSLCFKNLFDFTHGFGDSLNLIFQEDLSLFIPENLYESNLNIETKFSYLDLSDFKFKEL